MAFLYFTYVRNDQTGASKQLQKQTICLLHKSFSLVSVRLVEIILTH